MGGYSILPNPHDAFGVKKPLHNRGKKGKLYPSTKSMIHHCFFSAYKQSKARNF